MVPLLETVLKITFRNTSQQSHVLGVRNVSKTLSLQGIFYFWKEPKITGG
jgi:hypothetical protein